MGFNFGVFAGGAADGYRKQSEDMRKQAEEKRKQKEQDLQDKERAKFDEIMKTTRDEYNETRRINTDGNAMPKLDQYGAEPAQQGMATDAIISNQIAGKTEAPQSVNSIVARGLGMSEEPQQASRPLSVAAQGITPVAMMAPKQAEPKYREPDHNDKFNMTDKAYSRLLEAGLFDKAKEIGQFRSAMLAEKLQTDEKARVEAVRAGAIAVKSRNIEAIRSAAKNISQFVPDGMDVNDVQLTPEGKYKISYGNNAPVELDENQLMSTMLGAGDTKTLLEYDNRITQAGLEAARDKQNAKHQDETAANTAEHYKATARNQAAELGIKKADSDAKRGAKDYKIEGSEVATVLGDPAVDKNGKPVVDIMSGRQVVNRNPAREDAFYKWMAQNGITDTNEGLAKYKGNPQVQPPAPANRPSLSNFQK